MTESVVGPGATIGAGAHVHRSVVLADAHIADGARFERAGDRQRWDTGVVDGNDMRAGDRGDGRPAAGGRADRREAGRRLGQVPSAVVIAGMGGSAMGGELLRALVAGDCPVPVTRVRAFGLPSWAGPGTLVVCVELLRRHGRDAGLRRPGAPSGRGACSASGWAARSAERAEAWSAPFAQVPGGLHPRAALGYLFGAMAGAFATCGLARRRHRRRVRAEGAAACDREAAADLGRRLARTVPLIYGTGRWPRWRTAGRRSSTRTRRCTPSAMPSPSSTTTRSWAGRGRRRARSRR